VGPERKIVIDAISPRDGLRRTNLTNNLTHSMKITKGKDSLIKLVKVTINIAISYYEPSNLSKNSSLMIYILSLRSFTEVFYSADH
jgi:hypothetical protein